MGQLHTADAVLQPGGVKRGESEGGGEALCSTGAVSLFPRRLVNSPGDLPT